MKRLMTGVPDGSALLKPDSETQLNDLAALRAIAVYLCEELTRLEMDSSLPLEALPDAIDREIKVVRGRRSSHN